MHNSGLGEGGHSSSLAYETWPEADESLLVVGAIELPVQLRVHTGVIGDVLAILQAAGALRASF